MVAASRVNRCLQDSRKRMEDLRAQMVLTDGTLQVPPPDPDSPPPAAPADGVRGLDPRRPRKGIREDPAAAAERYRKEQRRRSRMELVHRRIIALGTTGRQAPREVRRCWAQPRGRWPHVPPPRERSAAGGRASEQGKRAAAKQRPHPPRVPEMAVDRSAAKLLAQYGHQQVFRCGPLRKTPPAWLSVWNGMDRSGGPIRVRTGHLRTMTEVLRACAVAVQPPVKPPEHLWLCDGTAITAIDQLSPEHEYLVTALGFPFHAAIVPFRLEALAAHGSVWQPRRDSRSARDALGGDARAQAAAERQLLRVRTAARGPFSSPPSPRRAGSATPRTPQGLASPVSPLSPRSHPATKISTPTCNSSPRGPRPPRHFPASLCPGAAPSPAPCPPAPSARGPRRDGAEGDNVVVWQGSGQTPHPGDSSDSSSCSGSSSSEGSPRGEHADSWEDGWQRVVASRERDGRQASQQQSDERPSDGPGRPPSSQESRSQPQSRTPTPAPPKATPGQVRVGQIALHARSMQLWVVESLAHPSAAVRRVLLPSQLPLTAPSAWRATPDNVLLLSDQHMQLPAAELAPVLAPPPLLFHVDDDGDVGPIAGHMQQAHSQAVQVDPPAPERGLARSSSRQDVGSVEKLLRRGSSRRIHPGGPGGGSGGGSLRRRSSIPTLDRSESFLPSDAGRGARAAWFGSVPLVERFLVPVFKDEEEEKPKKRVRFNDLCEVREFEPNEWEDSDDSYSGSEEEEETKALRARLAAITQEVDRRAREFQRHRRPES
eukprot:TRINITY_DN46951_c0_g1_i1.p1 TRINITY_DN46951_c0_g1~~TRINITY_DN46951_c0_g1_i1.p1  ORF type:complete len:805 (+),score=159.06 TRINITY_DN46951_c0_g1_i1:108-2417(+)